MFHINYKMDQGGKKMVNEKVRTLILETSNPEYSQDFGDYIVSMHCNEKEEALYSEFSHNGEGRPQFETVELAVNIEGIIKIRDWLNSRIDVINRRVYGEA